MQTQLTLYQYWRSSCSWRVRWVLALKNLSYQSVPINLLKNEQDSPAYLAKNPAGLLPCLEVNGKVLVESLAIIEWLEETYPQNPILPRESWDRAKVREIALTIAAGIQPLQNLRVQRHHSEDPKERELWSRYFIEKGLKLVEGQLERIEKEKASLGRYCYGDSLTLADIFLIPQVYNAKRFAVDFKELPRCAAVYEHCLSEPACAASSPERQPDAPPSA